MNKKHTMPSRLIELEHELSAALIKVDDQRELLRLAKEENEEKRKDIVWTMGERAKLMDRIKQLEEMYEGEIQSLKYNIDRVMGMYPAKDNQICNLLNICRANGVDVSSHDLIHGKEAKL